MPHLRDWGRGALQTCATTVGVMQRPRIHQGTGRTGAVLLRPPGCRRQLSASGWVLQTVEDPSVAWADMGPPVEDPPA
eukprot:14438148-Alexandrium_andersonii.AAC.1